MSDPRIEYVPRSNTSAAVEVDTLAAVYRFVLFESRASKGGLYDLMHTVATDWPKTEGASQGKKGKK
jgi:hypothetical protein